MTPGQARPGPRGIVGYGTYVPSWRLDRSLIAAALDLPSGTGTRAVASYDEDATTMAVEAGRAALAVDRPVASLVLATASPPYLDKTNAAAVHGALGLDVSVGAYDLSGAVRSGMGALRFALGAPGDALAILADMRTGLPGSHDEREGGDGAAAFVVGEEPLAELVAVSSTTAEFLDRWRTPGDDHSTQWEERFGEHAYVPLAQQAVAEAFERAGIAAADLDHLVVTGLHGRAVRRVRATSGVAPAAVSDDHGARIGNAGTAQPGIVLADVLDRAAPDELICLVALADGVDVFVFRATAAIADHAPARMVVDEIAAGTASVSYPTFLSWRGQIRRDPPRRPNPDAPAAPPSHRARSWKFGFSASRCRSCGARHLPPGRVCRQCGRSDEMQPERLVEVGGTVAAFIIDRLAYTPSPPLVAAVIDLDGGGRFRCALTDVDPESVVTGMRVELTFRRWSTTDGVHNYFWKARPVRTRETVEV